MQCVIYPSKSFKALPSDQLYWAADKFILWPSRTTKEQQSGRISCKHYTYVCIYVYSYVHIKIIKYGKCIQHIKTKHTQYNYMKMISLKWKMFETIILVLLLLLFLLQTNSFMYVNEELDLLIWVILSMGFGTLKLKRLNR